MLLLHEVILKFRIVSINAKGSLSGDVLLEQQRAEYSLNDLGMDVERKVFSRILCDHIMDFVDSVDVG